MDTFVDYYKLLHVQPSAPAAVIKASYRTMLQKLNHHPDRGGDVAFAQLLNAAATTLCNPQARAHYDQLRQQQLAEDKATQTRPNGKPHEWGEPGGSPAGSRNPRADKKEQAEDEAADTSQQSRTDPHHEDPAAAPLSLPAKPQCPFCLSPYPSSNPEILAIKGYTNTNRCQVCNAARTPIAQVPESSSDELRRMHRRHHETPARLWTYWPASAPANSILTDFSPAGCALTYAHAVAQSDVVMLETELFNAICNVRHCKPSGSGLYAIGLEFLTLDMLARPGTLLIASA